MLAEQTAQIDHERSGSFEALVYSKNREVVLRCCRAFTQIPLNWMTLDDANLASEYLGREHFHFVLLDLDSADAPSVLQRLRPSKDSQVLVISAGATDPTVLDTCYKSQFFYPVRHDDIESHLERAIQLVESSSITEPLAPPRASINSKQQEILRNEVFAHDTEPEGKPIQPLVAMKALAGRVFEGASGMFRMRHSLSIAAHERAASFIAAFGAIWFVSEITTNFTQVANIGPPPRGPLELVGIAVLLWLCAKHRRISELKAVRVEAA